MSARHPVVRKIGFEASQKFGLPSCLELLLCGRVDGIDVVVVVVELT